MNTYVLVHGAWHGSWCWAAVAWRLQQLGHQVITVDLPGRAGDHTEHSAITLNDFVERVAKVVTLQPSPVILVGHSMGGVTITQVAERIPERIQHLVYVTAFYLQNGQSLAEVSAAEGAPPPFTVDPVAGSMVLNAGPTLRDVFFNHCSDADAHRALAMLVPEPLAPATTPVSTSAARYGSVPRTYVECLNDAAIPIALQRRMVSAQPGTRVLTLDADHSPFLSRPAALAAQLASIE